MKTSNIILLAIFASILVWILATFLTIKNKMHEFTEDLTQTETQEVIKDLSDGATKLEDFNTIKVEGNGSIEIMQFPENNISMSEHEDLEMRVEDNILYINLKNDKRIMLRAKNLKNILIKDRVNVDIQNLSADTLAINTKDNAEISVQNLEVNFIKLKSEDNSEVYFRNANKKGTEAEFDIKDRSNVAINNTRGMSISVKKGADAKYKDY